VELWHLTGSIERLPLLTLRQPTLRILLALAASVTDINVRIGHQSASRVMRGLLVLEIVQLLKAALR